VPISPALAAELGVPEDADDATVLEAVNKLRTPTPAPPAPKTEEGETTTDTPADVEALVTARVNAAITAAVAPVIARLGEATDQLAEIRKRDTDSEKSRVITAALRAGKITPAQRASWEADYDQAPAIVTAALDRIAPNSAVHVTAAGRTGSEVESLDDEAAALVSDYERLLAGGR
jgi:phage I-like protein